MPSTRRFPLLPLFTLVGLMACSASNETGGGGGAPPNTGGTSGPGTTTAAGGSTTASSVPATGGESTPASTMDTGGVPETGGTPDTGGSTTGDATPTGGTTTTGGTSAAAGTTTSRDAGAAGAGGRGGSATAGAGGGAAGAAGGSPPLPPPPPPGTIPTGYPTPTADVRAKCQTVAIGQNNACAGQPTGNVCIQCLFGGSSYNTSETSPTSEATSAAGNYVVTVTLGGAAAGDTYVSAESSRGLLQSVTTTAGQSLTYAFVVNVRAMEGQPKHAGGPGGYPGLDLFFSGKSPQVSAIGYAKATDATKPIMVYMASDSTGCDQTGGEFGGWGQMLPEYFGPPVGIANYANSGASSSFAIWSSTIKPKLTAGDWAIIQFGHNDKTRTDAEVQSNLEGMVSDAQAAKVNAILVSPPARAGSVPVGNQSGLHSAAAKAAAEKKGVPFIDLTALSSDWYDNVCKTTAVAMTYHAHGTDGTHTNLPGAEKIAGLVVKAIKDQNIGLAQYLRQ